MNLEDLLKHPLIQRHERAKAQIQEKMAESGRVVWDSLKQGPAKRAAPKVSGREIKRLKKQRAKRGHR